MRDVHHARDWRAMTGAAKISEVSSPELRLVSLAAIRSVAVGSTNPVKIAAVRAVIARVAPKATIDGIAVPSGVPEQPFGDDETIRGARSRARAARARLDADLGVGIEGGVVEESDGGMRTCAWAVAVSRDGRVGTGGSLAMPLPPAVARAIRQGAELGHAMDAVTGLHDTKRGQGAVGILTSGLIDRQRAYEALITYALAPLLAPEFWGDTGAPAELDLFVQPHGSGQ
jgi:inosine/xanthosine triphosphatase